MNNQRAPIGFVRRHGGTVVALAPAVVLAVLSISVAMAFGNGIGRGWDVVLPHLAVVMSFIGIAYALFAVRASLGLDERSIRSVIFVLVLAFSVTLVFFYFIAFASYFLFKELPTRQLITGYVEDIPALLTALPIGSDILVVLVGGAAIVSLSIGLIVALCLDRGRSIIEEWARSSMGKVLYRVALYASSVHLLFAFAVPLDWHVGRNEPIFSSWHDVRLATAYIFGQKNPAQVALDRRAEEAYPRNAAKRTPNVILVYVDALRADAAESYGAKRPNMPFISSMVSSGALHQVDVALAACPSTICGLAAILQSRPTWLQSADNFSLPRVLHLQGYRNAYVLASNHQDFFNLKDYYRPFDFYLDGKDISRSRHGDDYLVLEGLTRLGAWDGRPTFLMLGLISPHVGGIRAEQNRRYKPDRILLTANSKAWGEAFRNNYDNGVIQADDVLRQVWNKLEELRYLDDAIVVITADHGESLGEHEQWGHLRSLNYAELMIPLWIHDPRGSGDFRNFARQIDIAPTILGALGLPVPSTWHGQPMRDLGEIVWSVHYVPDFPNKISVIRRDPERILKYDFDRASGIESVVDVVSDPREEKNLVSETPTPLLEQMRNQANAVFIGK